MKNPYIAITVISIASIILATSLVKTVHRAATKDTKDSKSIHTQQKKSGRILERICIDGVEYIHVPGYLVPHYYPDGSLYTCGEDK